MPRDEFRPHAQESAKTQRPPHGLRNVERHRPRQARVAAAGLLYAHAQPSEAQLSDAQPSDVQPSDAQPSDAQPASWIFWLNEKATTGYTRADYSLEFHKIS